MSMFVTPDVILFIKPGIKVKIDDSGVYLNDKDVGILGLFKQTELFAELWAAWQQLNLELSDGPGV
jgi:hypothetical protein